MKHFWDNAPVYTMHIGYGMALFMLGYAVGSIITGVLVKRAYRRWYTKKLDNSAKAYHNLKESIKSIPK